MIWKGLILGGWEWDLGGNWDWKNSNIIVLGSVKEWETILNSILISTLISSLSRNLQNTGLICYRKLYDPFGSYVSSEFYLGVLINWDTPPSLSRHPSALFFFVTMVDEICFSGLSKSLNMREHDPVFFFLKAKSRRETVPLVVVSNVLVVVERRHETFPIFSDLIP